MKIDFTLFINYYLLNMYYIYIFYKWRGIVCKV